MRRLYRHPGVRGLEQLRCPLPVRVSCAPPQTHGTLFGQPTSEPFARSAADGEAPGRSDGRATACRRASPHVTLSHGSSGAAASRESPATARRLTRSVRLDGAASPSRRRRRRSASRSRRSRSCSSGPLRPPPGIRRPRAQFDSAHHNRHRSRRRPWHRRRTSPTSYGRRSPERCTPPRRAGRTPIVPRSARRSPGSGVERARPRPGASAHAPRNGRTLRGSSPGRTGTSRRPRLARRSEPPHRRPFPAAPKHRHVVRPSPPPCRSMRRATPPRVMRDTFSRCPPRRRSPGVRAARMPSRLACMGRSTRVRGRAGVRDRLRPVRRADCGTLRRRRPARASKPRRECAEMIRASDQTSF